jgi:hypothetical protein
MFGFACARCWDKDCSCTEEELRQHRLTENNTSLEKTKSEPHVMCGDIVFKNDVEYIVKRVVDGIGIISRVTNVADEMEFDAHYLLPFGSSDRVCLVKT